MLWLTFYLVVVAVGLTVSNAIISRDARKHFERQLTEADFERLLVETFDAHELEPDWPSDFEWPERPSEIVEAA